MRTRVTKSGAERARPTSPRGAVAPRGAAIERGVAVAVAVAVAVTLVRPATARAADEDVQPTFAGLEPGSDAAETFRLNALGIVRHEESAASFFSFVVGGRWWRPTRGKFRHATAYDDFYRMLGRPDLADQHERRRLVTKTLYWGGAATMLGGLVVFVTGMDDGGVGARAKLGAGLFAGGLVASAIGAAFQPPLVPEAEAIEMAGAYNRRLRVHLGLPAAAREGRAGRAPFGLALRGRF